MLKKDWPSTSVLARPTRGPRSHPTRRARAAPRAPPSTGPREQAPPRDPIPASLHSPPPRPARPPPPAVIAPPPPRCVPPPSGPHPTRQYLPPCASANRHRPPRPAQWPHTVFWPGPGGLAGGCPPVGGDCSGAADAGPSDGPLELVNLRGRRAARGCRRAGSRWHRLVQAAASL